MQALEQLNFGTQVISNFKKLYAEKKETIEYMCKFGTPIERAKASMVRDVALAGETYIRQ